MAGGKFDLATKYWYPQVQPGGLSVQPLENLLQSLLTTLVGSVSGLSGGKAGPGDLSQPDVLPNGITGFNNTHNNDPSNQPETPKAYLNWVLFDEQFKYVPEGSGFLKVPTYSSSIQSLGRLGIEVPKSGYLYVYLSNETEGKNVFFDNFVVNHYTGPLLEETHYYPFGLTMGGISSQALGTGDGENKKLFNSNELQNKEFRDLSGLEWTDFNARSYDQQTGRFLQIDPEVEDDQQSMTPYQFGTDNPIRYNDPSGKCPWCLVGALIGAAVDYGSQVVSNRLEGKNWTTSFTSINRNELAVATIAGAASGGVSSLYASVAVTGTKMLLTEAAAQGVVAGTSSVSNQINDNLDKGRNPINISVPQVALDIATDHLSSNMAERIVPASNLSGLERQANRAEKIAANDPASSGRAANAQQAKGNLDNATNMNYAKQTATSNASSSVAGEAAGFTIPANPATLNIPSTNTDASFVKRPLVSPLLH